MMDLLKIEASIFSATLVFKINYTGIFIVLFILSYSLLSILLFRRIFWDKINSNNYFFERYISFNNSLLSSIYYYFKSRFILKQTAYIWF